MNEENKVTLCQVVKEIINSNQLTAMEEAEIRKILEEKGKKKEDVSKTCLAEIVGKEMEEGLKSGKYNEFFKKWNQPIIEKYFKKGKLAICLWKSFLRQILRNLFYKQGKYTNWTKII